MGFRVLDANDFEIRFRLVQCKYWMAHRYSDDACLDRLHRERHLLFPHRGKEMACGAPHVYWRHRDGMGIGCHPPDIEFRAGLHHCHRCVRGHGGLVDISDIVSLGSRRGRCSKSDQLGGQLRWMDRPLFGRISQRSNRNLHLGLSLPGFLIGGSRALILTLRKNCPQIIWQSIRLMVQSPRQKRINCK